jgi:hypothetical protein
MRNRRKIAEWSDSTQCPGFADEGSQGGSGDGIRQVLRLAHVSQEQQHAGGNSSQRLAVEGEISGFGSRLELSNHPLERRDEVKRVDRQFRHVGKGGQGSGHVCETVVRAVERAQIGLLVQFGVQRPVLGNSVLAKLATFRGLLGSQGLTVLLLRETEGLSGLACLETKGLALLGVLLLQLLSLLSLRLTQRFPRLAELRSEGSPLGLGSGREEGALLLEQLIAFGFLRMQKDLGFVALTFEGLLAKGGLLAQESLTADAELLAEGTDGLLLLGGELVSAPLVLEEMRTPTTRRRATAVLLGVAVLTSTWLLGLTVLTGTWLLGLAILTSTWLMGTSAVSGGTGVVLLGLTTTWLEASSTISNSGSSDHVVVCISAGHGFLSSSGSGSSDRSGNSDFLLLYQFYRCA